MNKFIIASAAAAVISAGASVPVNAQTSVAYSSDPIKVVRYAIDPAFSTALSAASEGANQELPSTGSVTVSFVNSGSVPVTSVVFALRTGKQTEIIVDKGTFSTGARITHDFAAGSELDGTSALEIQKVTLADGSVWQHA